MRTIFLALALVAASAQADDGLRQLGEETRKAWNTCASKARAADRLVGVVSVAESVRRIEEARACGRDAQSAYAERFKAVLATGPAAESLRQYQAAWRGALAGLPRSAEGDAYAESNRRILEAWARFEIDAGL